MGIEASTCMATNRFLDYAETLNERYRDSIKRSGRKASKGGRRNRAYDYLTAWLYLLDTADETDSDGRGLADAVDFNADEGYSKYNPVGRAFQSYLSRLRGNLNPYLLRYSLDVGIFGDAFNRRLLFFLDEVAPDFFPRISFPGGFKTFSCLSRRQFDILRLFVEEFSKPVSTRILNRKTKEPIPAMVGQFRTQFSDWGDLLRYKATLPAKYRLEEWCFIRHLMEVNGNREKANRGHFVPLLKEKEIRYLLTFHNLKDYTAIEIRLIGLVGARKRIDCSRDEEIEIFKLLRKK